MSFLLDTNVVSEWVKPRPHQGVIAWLAEADEDRVFLSVVTLAELRHGIERMAAGSRRERLDVWLREELPLRFEKRVLSIDAAVADAWQDCFSLPGTRPDDPRRGRLSRRRSRGAPAYAGHSQHLRLRTFGGKSFLSGA